MQKTAKSNDQKAHSNSPSDASLRHCATIPEIRVIPGQNSATSGAPDSEQPGTKNEKPGTRTLPKPCRTCRRELPVTAFYQHRGCRDARRPECKHCTGLRCSETRAARRRQAPETLRCRWCREI